MPSKVFSELQRKGREVALHLKNTHHAHEDKSEKQEVFYCKESLFHAWVIVCVKSLFKLYHLNLFRFTLLPVAQKGTPLLQ